MKIRRGWVAAGVLPLACFAAWAGEDDARTSLFLRTGAIQMPGQMPGQMPTLFGGVPDSGSTLLPQTPADRGELAFCFDRAVPPSPEIMEAIERSVLNALNNFYQQGSRWPGAAGAPVNITWSFVPDGTNIPNGVGEGAGPSNLFASMDSKFGGNRALWISQFQACFDRWAALTGTSYTRIQWNGNAWDDGAAFGNGGANGAAGLRGDVRISAKNIDGASGTLAYNYYPGFGGDMVLDSSESWGNNTGSYVFLRNTVLHEHGHGVGMLHVCPTNGTKLMEPFLNTGFDGPQHDDIRGVTNLYGDPYESNNTAATATNLGNLAPGGSSNPSGIPAPAVSNAALTAVDVSGDSDFYRFNLTSATTVSINCVPTGLNYDSSPQCGSGNFVNSVAIAGLSASIIASDGSTVIHTNNVAVGNTLNIINIPVPAGLFFVRVFANSAHSVPQMYNLTVSAANLAAPANNACANAIAIGLGTVNGTNVGATADGGDSCRGNTNLDVWYSFTPSCTGTLAINTCGSALDTVVSVHSACIGTTANQIACNDDNGGQGPCPGGLTSYLSVPVVAGTNYKVRVAGFAQGQGTFTMNLSMPTPSNDACANAPLVTNGTYTGDTCPATFSATDGTASCGASGSSRDVWYRWTAPCTGNLVLNTCGSAYDTVISVHTGACGSLTQIACNDDAGNNGACPFTLQSYLSVPVTSGTTYYIRVAGFSSNAGAYVLTIDQQINDRCANASTAIVGANPFSTLCATVDGPGNCGASTNSPDVWFAYTAPCSGTATMYTCGSAYDTVINAFSGSCGSLTSIICNDDAPAGPCAFTLLSYISFPQTAGETYLIRVSGFNNQSGTGTLTIESACGCDPDLNQDGNVDQDDVTYLINVIGGGANPAGIDPDFNQDGNVDQDDVTALINAVGGGGCP